VVVIICRPNFITKAECTNYTSQVPHCLPERNAAWCTKSSATAVRRISPTWSSSTRRTHNDVSSGRH